MSGSIAIKPAAGPNLGAPKAHDPTAATAAQSVLRFDRVSKIYSHSAPRMLLRRGLLSWIRRSGTDAFYALREVSFDLRGATSLAVVGANGAGKSTLLRCATGISVPDQGAVRVCGTIAALMELGAGFHPDLTGRENVFLNASLLGLTRKQTYEQFDRIVEFSGLVNFIEEPLRTYSSGMMMRLAFSVAVRVDPDILVIDEILSVGDIEFQDKCVAEISRLKQSGKTLLCVSHDMNTLRRLCEQALWLERGQLRLFGPCAEVIDAYESAPAPGSLLGVPRPSTRGMEEPVSPVSVRSRKQITIAVLLLAIACPASAGVQPRAVREVEFNYHTEITGIDSRSARLEAWIPLPREDRFQQVSALSIAAPVHVEVIDQPNGGNRLAHLVAAAPLPLSIPVTIRFKVRRIEQAADAALARRFLPEPKDGQFAGYLGPDRLVPIDGEIARVSLKISDENASSYEQAKAIYRYVIANMAYDKSGAGWGRGDAIYACNVKRGNCTDFHSLFIALARSRGIPARFTIGFPLGAASTGTIPGYHCWAEFYSGGQWVPVDASEAWQHPEMRRYYFGHLDADRVAFTMGRDLVLRPRQHGAPLNFLIYPYVEVDGKPTPPAQIKNRFEYAGASNH